MVRWHQTQWTWVWAKSGREWRTGKPGLLWSMGWKSQTWLRDWTTTITNSVPPAYGFCLSLVNGRPQQESKAPRPLLPLVLVPQVLLLPPQAQGLWWLPPGNFTTLTGSPEPCPCLWPCVKSSPHLLWVCPPVSCQDLTNSGNYSSAPHLSWGLEGDLWWLWGIHRCITDP